MHKKILAEKSELYDELERKDPVAYHAEENHERHDVVRLRYKVDHLPKHIRDKEKRP
jgi:hypothetical protein